MIDKMDFIKIINICFQMTMLRELEDKPRFGS